MKPIPNNGWFFFLSNWRFTYVIVLAILLLGVFSVLLIPKESDPDVEIPVAVVSTAFPGASAQDVEELVTKPIEDRLIGLEHVDEITSTSSSGFSSIVVTYDVNVAMDDVINDLKDRVEEAKRELPADGDEPSVQRIRFSDEPVLTIALSGPYSVPELKYYAEELSDEIERVSGVSSVDVTGGQEREIQVRVNKAALDRFGLSLGQVTNAIRTANSDIPIGSVETAGEVFTLRFDGGISNGEEIKQIAISSIAGVPVYVRDVAEVEDTFTKTTTISKLYTAEHGLAPSVSLGVRKISGGNVIQTVDNVWTVIEQAQQEFLPEEVVIETVADNAQYIRDDLKNLTLNGLETVVIVMILLFIFLGWRESILAGMGIPLTFLITFAVLYPLGYTLNFLSLFSLILSLGIIVDGSIVITEGIHREILDGKEPRYAAYRAIKHFSAPLIAGTLTTVFAFLPMVTTSGIIGKFIESIPVTITIVLSASLFVGLAITPAVGSKWLKSSQKGGHGVNLHIKEETRRERLTGFLSTRYERILAQFLESRFLKRSLFALMMVLFVASVSLPVVGLLKVDMFPSEDESSFFIDIEEPFGTPLQATEDRLQLVEETVMSDPRVESYLVRIQSGKASFTVNLFDEREETSQEITEEYQHLLPELTEAKTSAYQLSSGPGAAAEIQVRITGPELSELDALGYQVEDFLRTIPGTANVDTTIKSTNGEFLLRVDRTKAQIYGLSTTDIAGLLRNAVSGTSATTIRNSASDAEVIVLYELDPFHLGGDSSDEIDLQAISGITIATREGDIPLSSLVEISFSGSRAEIEHKDGDRIIYVNSGTAGGVEAQDIFTALEEEISGWSLPPGYVIDMGGEREDIQQSFTDMLRAMVMGIFLIAGLLVWQFRSYRQPLFILSTLPLALIGVLPGLVLVNKSLSFPGLIGIVALTGIVVNNAIILIDRINYNRKQGMDVDEAISEAARSRLQPILLTTITTVVGLLPLSLSSGTWGPIGYSIIFGLLFSTVLTLLVVPLLYQSFGEKELE